jgi:hypothetical protein
VEHLFVSYMKRTSALLVLDEETDYQTWCNHFLGVVKGSLEQILERDATRENSSLD